MSEIFENPISLTEAAKLAKVTYQTTCRWSSVGCRGVILDTCLIGGRRKTSLAAIQRFLDRLNGAGQEVAHA